MATKPRKRLIPEGTVKKIRFDRSELLDVEPFCGFPLKIRIGEVPLEHQPDLFKLLESTNNVAGEGNSVRHREMSESLRPVLLSSLLNEEGESLTSEDLKDLFDVIPAGEVGGAFMKKMLETLVAKAAKKVSGPLAVSTSEPETSSSDSASDSASNIPTT